MWILLIMAVMLYSTMGLLLAIIFGDKKDPAMQITIGIVWPIMIVGAIVYSIIRVLIKLKGGKEC